MTIIKIKIRVAQNVGKVWISRKKNLPAPFGAIPGNLLRGPEKLEKCTKKMSIFLGGPMGPIQPLCAIRDGLLALQRWWAGRIISCVTIKLHNCDKPARTSINACNAFINETG